MNSVTQFFTIILIIILVFTLSFTAYTYTSLGVFSTVSLLIISFLGWLLKSWKSAWRFTIFPIAIVIIMGFLVDLMSERKTTYCASYALAVVPSARKNQNVDEAMKVMDDCVKSLAWSEYFCTAHKYMYRTSQTNTKNIGCSKVLSNLITPGY